MSLESLAAEYAVTTTQAASAKPLIHVVVFAAGPLETGNLTPTQNFRAACLVAEDLRRNAAQYGIRATVIIPHASLFVDAVTPRYRREWLIDGRTLLERADVVFRYGGRSEGADAETRHAQICGVPVAYGLGQFVDWCRARADRGASGNDRSMNGSAR